LFERGRKKEEGSVSLLNAPTQIMKKGERF
jgi:hypothetical protein